MVIDSSAILAILLGEPDAERYAAAIELDPVRMLGAVTALETAIVILQRKERAGGHAFDAIVQRAQIEIVPFTADHWVIARDAWSRYGKGRHRAGLDFGDCCAYATAKVAGEKLLFKGHDFGSTDIEPAI
ncbi:MAG: type II toxin-antitoxin system VapC family toxin [Alphaproteobacteria bacterium]|nr:type II toxin-antitoxin system VapC family toxin [Alphaproteobacteria bacterium]